MSIRKKRIKLNGKNYNIGVYTYSNNRIRLKYENDTESHDITVNLDDSYIDNGKIFLDPFIKNNGILKELKKKRIIKEICGSFYHNGIEIPIASLNMGILREYDYYGVFNHFDKVGKNEQIKII